MAQAACGLPTMAPLHSVSWLLAAAPVTQLGCGSRGRVSVLPVEGCWGSSVIPGHLGQEHGCRQESEL